MKIALVGLGMISATFAAAIRYSDRVTLSKVFARREESRAAFLAAHPDLGAGAAGSVQEIAEDPDIDFVIVTTPPDARAEIVEALVGAGKPILMEKPIERSHASALRIVTACEAAGVPLGVTLQHRARPQVAAFHSVRDALGPPLAVENHVPWWRPQSYYDEPGRGTYARDGGGVLITQAIHPIDLMLSLTGPVAEVTAMCATTGLHRMEAEDFVVAGLGFKNGAVGQHFASTASFPGRSETLVLHCRNGSATMDREKLTIHWQDGGVEELGHTFLRNDPMAQKSDWHRLIIEDFAEAITRGKPPLVPGRAALEAQALIEAIEEASRTGKRCRLDEPTVLRR